MYRPRLNYRVNGHNVRLLNPELADRIAQQTGLPFTGWENVDSYSLDADTRAELVALAPLLGKMVDPDDALAINKQMNEAAIKIGSVGAAERAAAMEQRKKNEAEGQTQLRAYYAAGLEDCKENADIIADWIISNAQSIFAKASVTSAVEFNRARLRWKKVEPVVAPTPVVEEVVTLSDGSK